MDRFQQIEQRKAEIRELLKGPDADLDALEAEVSALDAELRELQDKAEKRAALVASVTGGDPKVIRSFQPAPEAEPTYGVDSPEYRTAWVKNLQGKDLTDTEKRAYATGDSANAIPTAVADKFFEKLKKIAPMLNEITLLRVAGNLKFMAEGTNNAAAAHVENTAVAAATDTVVSVTLGSTEFMKVIRISRNAASMSVSAFEDWLVSMLSRDIARAIDNFIINDATKGIAVCTTWTSGTNQILNTTGCTYANIVSLIALLPAGYDPNAKFLMHKATLWNKVAQIVDSAGNPILLRDMENGFSPRLLGYPVIVDDYVSSANGAIYLGDFEQVVGNLSQDVLVERSSESGFLNNSIDYRGTAQFDSQVANTEAVVRYVSTTA